jgi:hypothetical protein
MANSYFSDMIHILRTSEEVILYANRFDISEAENANVKMFLEQEFEIEKLDYPEMEIEFQPESALWAAHVVYMTAQLLLFRKDHPEKLTEIIPKDIYELSVENVLSVDLCLRFLSPLVHELKVLDSNDELIPILDHILDKWHYSNIEKADLQSNFNPDFWLKSQGFGQLYIDRIIHFKNEKLASNPSVNYAVSNTLSIYGASYWNGFSSIRINE